MAYSTSAQAEGKTGQSDGPFEVAGWEYRNAKTSDLASIPPNVWIQNENVKKQIANCMKLDFVSLRRLEPADLQSLMSVRIIHIRHELRSARMQRPLYDQLVPYYVLIEGRNWQREVKLIVSILRKHRSSTVVDLGCGVGYHVKELEKLGFKTTGLDISRQNIQLARRMADKENVHPSFVAGSYYHYRPGESADAVLFLNWSIPVRDHEVKRFLDNANAMLRPGGLLILDFERQSQIVWSDVGKAIVDSWRGKKELIVRVSVGQIVSNVLCSRDVYVIYPDSSRPRIPNEASRYQAAQRRGLARIYVDYSYVRFFSLPEMRRFARRSGFGMVQNFLLRRGKYKRNYTVLQKLR